MKIIFLILLSLGITKKIPIEKCVFKFEFAVINKYRHSRFQIAEVYTPQHCASKELLQQSPYWFHFDNSGILWSEVKQCYEVYIKQRGWIDTETWYFKTLETKEGAHNIYFHDEFNFQKFLF